MIIQILSNLQEDGYLAKSFHPTIAPFFAGANVAFQRKALEEIGDFDPKCITGEDCDMCVRLSTANWELYMRRAAFVFHRNPSTLSRLVRQWYGYGRYHPYIFAKHNPPAIELYNRIRRPIAGERYSCLFYRYLPIRIVIFITNFLILTLAGIWTITTMLLGWTTLGWIGIGIASISAISYAIPDLKHSGLRRGLEFTGIRYLADSALFIGALIGGLKQRMLYLSATVD